MPKLHFPVYFCKVIDYDLIPLAFVIVVDRQLIKKTIKNESLRLIIKRPTGSFLTRLFNHNEISVNLPFEVKLKDLNLYESSSSPSTGQGPKLGTSKNAPGFDFLGGCLKLLLADPFRLIAGDTSGVGL